MLDQSAICLQVLGKCHQAEGTPVQREAVWLSYLQSAANIANTIADPEARRGCFRSIEKSFTKLSAELEATRSRHAAA